MFSQRPNVRNELIRCNHCGNITDAGTPAYCFIRFQQPLVCSQPWHKYVYKKTSRYIII